MEEGPSSKDQGPNKRQFPSAKNDAGGRAWRLGFGTWAFLGTLSLVLFTSTSCTPSSRPAGERLDSKLFASAQIIGERGGGAGQFNKPRSVAVDGDDNIFVVDMTGRVQKFTPEGEYLLSWQTPETDKGKAKGMGTALNGDVLLVEPHYTRVNRFDPRGKLLEQWGENGTNVGQLIFPRSLAVAPDGAIWVSEYAFAERIQKFTPGGTNVLLSVGRPGGGPGEFNRAEGIGVDAEGRLYTADSCNHRIQVFSADGTFLRQYGTPGNRPGEMSYPYDIRIDAGGRQFVCEFGNSRIQVFDREDRLVELIGGPGRAPGQFNNPWSIALDSQGNPDAVVLDMMLPKRSGFLVLEKIMEDANPPVVVMVTANQGKRHQTYAQNLGVHAYMTKPVSLQRLVDTLVRLLDGKANRSVPVE
jgi:CheY-like chemotaxis protein